MVGRMQVIRWSMGDNMNRKLNTIVMTLLMIASALAGCTSGDPDGDGLDSLNEDDLDALIQLIEESNVDWINDRGNATETWSISLEDDQWLEVKSTSALINWEDEGQTTTLTIGGAILEDEGWRVGSFSPIFGGDYTYCQQYVENVCWDNHNSSEVQFDVIGWSIIYRVHQL